MVLLGVYKPPIQSDSEFPQEIIRTPSHYITSSENILSLGDLNMTSENLNLINLLQIVNLNIFFNPFVPNASFLYHMET